MKQLLELVPLVANRIESPVLVVHGPIWPVTELVSALAGHEVTCMQFDVHQAGRLKDKLGQENLTATILTVADVWDVPTLFKTVIFPSSAHSDRELKIDLIEQAYHVVAPGGRFISLSEHDRDNAFHKWHKKVYGGCSDSPRTDAGMAFWSTRNPADEPRTQRRHRMTYHARIGESASMSFESWPGTFGYGRFDAGSRAMLEVADIRTGDKVLDMGCGDGSVGCLASQRVGTTGKITFVDSSVRAMKLTDINAKANGVANYELITSSTMTDLPTGAFDVVLANPPYYANSEVGRLFINTAREVLRPGGRFYFVTKMPVQTIPEIVETFGQVNTVENRGYTVVTAQA
jgi:16S rRNA G1207 methylase RsmC